MRRIKKPPYIDFIGYEEVLDSIETSAGTAKLGHRRTLHKILEETYSGLTATIVLYKQSYTITIKKDARQGDTISTMIFLACLQEFFRTLNWKKLEIKVIEEYPRNLSFAYHNALVSISRVEFPLMITKLGLESRIEVLKILRTKLK